MDQLILLLQFSETGMYIEYVLSCWWGGRAWAHCSHLGLVKMRDHDAVTVVQLTLSSVVILTSEPYLNIHI